MDHILAKAHYPALAVTLDNLAGSCTECNKEKGDTPAAAPEEVILHPYFENISEQRCLWANVAENPDASMLFSDLMEQLEIDNRSNLNRTMRKHEHFREAMAG